jgi:hypothetical protein
MGAGGLGLAPQSRGMGRCVASHVREPGTLQGRAAPAAPALPMDRGSHHGTAPRGAAPCKKWGFVRGRRARRGAPLLLTGPLCRAHARAKGFGSRGRGPGCARSLLGVVAASRIEGTGRQGRRRPGRGGVAGRCRRSPALQQKGRGVAGGKSCTGSWGGRFQGRGVWRGASWLWGGGSYSLRAAAGARPPGAPAAGPEAGHGAGEARWCRAAQGRGPWRRVRRVITAATPGSWRCRSQSRWPWPRG